MKASEEKRNKLRSMVGVSPEARDRARQLSEFASQHGWVALGVKRTDPPTIAAIFEEAINVLAARVTKGRSNK